MKLNESNEPQNIRFVQAHSSEQIKKNSKKKMKKKFKKKNLPGRDRKNTVNKF